MIDWLGSQVDWVQRASFIVVTAVMQQINSSETFAGQIDGFIINLITWYHDILYADVTCFLPP